MEVLELNRVLNLRVAESEQKLRLYGDKSLIQEDKIVNLESALDK